MKVFLINLDQDKEKLAFVDEQLKRLGVDYTRVAGIYGKSLPQVEYKAAFSKFRWWCAVGRPIVPAEIGCALSHYGIYRGMRAGEVVCILEDDVILGEEFPARLKEVEQFVDVRKPQVVMLSSHRHERQGRGVVRSSTAMCTDGYVITQPAAVALLKANLPMQVPCDHWWRWQKHGLIELFHALPTVVSQNQEEFGTSTQNGAILVKDYPFCKKVIHKFKRCIGKSIDFILP